MSSWLESLKILLYGGDFQDSGIVEAAGHGHTVKGVGRIATEILPKAQTKERPITLDGTCDAKDQRCSIIELLSFHAVEKGAELNSEDCIRI